MGYSRLFFTSPNDPILTILALFTFLTDPPQTPPTPPQEDEKDGVGTTPPYNITLGRRHCVGVVFCCSPSRYAEGGLGGGCNESSIQEL